MESLFFLAFVAAGAVGLGYYVRRRRRWAVATREAAHRLGLTWFAGEGRAYARNAGTIEGYQVRIDVVVEGTGEDRHQLMRITIAGSDDFGGLELKREAAFSGLAKVFTGRDIELGRHDFDNVIHVVSLDPANAVSRLGAVARAAVMKAIAGRGARLSSGVVELEEHRLISDSAELERIVRDLVRLVVALRDQPKRIEERLLLNATKDPSSSFGPKA